MRACVCVCVCVYVRGVEGRWVYLWMVGYVLTVHSRYITDLIVIVPTAQIPVTTIKFITKVLYKW